MALFKTAVPGAKKGNKPAAPVFVADDVKGPDGKVIYDQADVLKAISGFSEGKNFEKQGKTLMDTHRPILAEFARKRFASAWLAAGTRPSSPKIAKNEQVTGGHITMSFQDKPSNLTDEQFAEFANVVGAKNAEEAVDRLTQYTIDAAAASKKVTVNGTNDTFQQHIENALLAYFPADLHEAIGGMLKPKAVQATKKGILDKLPDMVGRKNPELLARAMLAARIVVSFKPGQVGDAEDED